MLDADYIVMQIHENCVCVSPFHCFCWICLYTSATKAAKCCCFCQRSPHTHTHPQQQHHTYQQLLQQQESVTSRWQQGCLSNSVSRESTNGGRQRWSNTNSLRSESVTFNYVLLRLGPQRCEQKKPFWLQSRTLLLSSLTRRHKNGRKIKGNVSVTENGTREKVWSNIEQSNRKVNITIIRMTRELIRLNPEVAENRPAWTDVFMKIKGWSTVNNAVEFIHQTKQTFRENCCNYSDLRWSHPSSLHLFVFVHN